MQYDTCQIETFTLIRAYSVGAWSPHNQEIAATGLLSASVDDAGH
jgi:hypothetical protein